MKRASWTTQQIRQHREAARQLCEIKDETFKIMRKNPAISEHEVAGFILDEFKKRNLKTDPDIPIVAFRENTSFVHYFPKRGADKKLKPESLIMLDIWARVDEKGAPFADITWMAWHGGDIPADIQKGFRAVITSRDNGLGYIEDVLKREFRVKNSKLARAMNGVVLSSGMQDFIPHGFGHSLGTTTCHGRRGRFLEGSKSFVQENIAYTIEPGIYVENKFGFRSEIDFYVDENNRLNITTEVQREIVRI